MSFPMIDMVATGARIQELRINHQLTVAQLRDYMGFCSDQAIYKWQRGESLPTVDNLYALSKLFGIPMDDILKGKEEESDKLSSSFILIYYYSYIEMLQECYRHCL